MRRTWDHLNLLSSANLGERLCRFRAALKASEVPRLKGRAIQRVSERRTVALAGKGPSRTCGEGTANVRKWGRCSIVLQQMYLLQMYLLQMYLLLLLGLLLLILLDVLLGIIIKFGAAAAATDVVSLPFVH